MEPLVRCKIPACVRTLLADIEPNDEEQWTDWPDSDLETVASDGILLPKRETMDSSELLTPAVKENKAESDSDVTPSRMCRFCLSKLACYTCPRCNLQYCGLACYRGVEHSACSEEFYKESVFQELKSRGITEKEGKIKMQEILLKLRHNQDGDGGVENVLSEANKEMDICRAGENAQALELLSRLAEIQSSGQGKCEEVKEILIKLGAIGNGASGKGGDEHEEEDDLAERFAGVDLDSLTEEEFWDLLTPNDKAKFDALIKRGGIGVLVPLWTPWWEMHEKKTEALVEELEKDREGDKTNKGNVAEEKAMVGTKVENKQSAGCEVTDEVRSKEHSFTGTFEGTRDEGVDCEDKYQRRQKSLVAKGGRKKGVKKQKEKQREDRSQGKGEKTATAVPSISANIPPLHSISSNPSPLVRYSLVNVLYGYTFSLRLFNGDLSEAELMQEFCQVVLTVSESLGSGRNFNSAAEALDAATAAVSSGRYFDREDPGAAARGVEAVAHVLTGESREDPGGYSLAALSQLRLVLTKARASLPKEEEDTRRKYFLAGKKCEFFQAWVKENCHILRGLAAGVWMEHQRMEGERKRVEMERKNFEKGRKKRNCRGNGLLIEEVN